MRVLLRQGKTKSAVARVVSRKLWRFRGDPIRASEGSSLQAARLRGIGSMGQGIVCQPSTLRVWIWPEARSIQSSIDTVLSQRCRKSNGFGGLSRSLPVSRTISMPSRVRRGIMSLLEFGEGREGIEEHPAPRIVGIMNLLLEREADPALLQFIGDRSRVRHRLDAAIPASARRTLVSALPCGRAGGQQGRTAAAQSFSNFPPVSSCLPDDCRFNSSQARLLKIGAYMTPDPAT